MMARLRMPYASVMVATTQIQLGDLPTWLAALGTVGALGAVLWQISTERSAATNASNRSARNGT